MHTLADPLRHACDVASDRVAIIDGERRLCYREFAERAHGLASGLRRLGLARGDRVAILASNCHQFLEVYVGVPAGGFVVVPLNTRLALPELRYALEDSGARVLIADRDVSGLADRVERTVLLGAEYEALCARPDEVALGQGVAEADLAGLFYTGGTTGRAKGVMLSHRNLIANTFHWMTTVGSGSEPVALIVAPLFHAAGSGGVLGNIWRTGTQVTLAAFDPGRALDLIAAHGVTELLVVPTMLAAMAEEQRLRPRAVDSLRMLAHGGSPIATEVLRRAARALPATELREVYGSTELAPLVTSLPREQDLLDHPRGRSCGRPVPGVRVRIVGPAGEPLPRGRVGEVVVSGPNVMLGYWGKPAETAAVLRDNEYRTGDVGYLDDGGYLYLVDRTKDMIVSGGENVYSTEVEEALYRHPAVLEAAVFGIPDDHWGEAVHAVVVPKREQTDVTAHELIEFCRNSIGGYKVPKGIDIRHEPLPKSGVGKILKRELRAPFWKGLERAVH